MARLRANSVINYQLPDGHVRVSSGIYGMASIWDYDIVLMAVSHLTERTRSNHSKNIKRPAQLFRPHINELLKFCKRGRGGSQIVSVIEALQRLSTTHVSITRTCNRGTIKKINVLGENLISSFNVISGADDKIDFVEIGISDWMYAAITSTPKPDVLRLHPDYFNISQGVGRFVYRLARRAAGKDVAVWGFKTLYERSGSIASFNEFSRLLRKVIRTQCVPEYRLIEELGQMGAMLRMEYCGKGTVYDTPSAIDPAASLAAGSEAFQTDQSNSSALASATPN